ncbi:type I-E CRISPR-associated protein Cse1/CasA [Brachybacterium squillarum]|uniref:type I-E CRISPR-associated protein Cse1/CasA n=1 Tax=Brachybacterium squillarum TaxID=661979 RepID=UPI0002629ADE|nr:type I-E CRISPR-associated protein Cse1/CasA [Brachybacterium squillarum]
MTTVPTFSLLTEPWIAVRLTDGSEAQLSLQQVFDGSTAVLDIRGDSPTQDYAVLRVLLAVFWRAHGPALDVRAGETADPDAWREDVWYAALDGAPDTAVLAYLERRRDRFDLLHPTTPFMQVADLDTTKGTRQEVQRIIPEAESDYFTLRAGAGLLELSYAEAARWLIHTQAFDYSGIKSGAIGDPRVKGGKGYPIGQGWTGLTGGTTVIGPDLRRTLVLNTTERTLGGGPADRPVWEREPDTAAERPVPVPGGAADLATWQSRRIRLFPEAGRITSVLVSNGDRIPEAGANVFGDPMTPYRYSSNKSTKTSDVYYPRPYDTSRMMWKSLEPLISLQGDPSSDKGGFRGRRPETLDALATLGASGAANLEGLPGLLDIRLTSASYGPQASSAATTVDARIGVPLALLDTRDDGARQLVISCARQTLDAAINLGSFAGQLLVAAGGEYAFRAEPTDTLLADLEPDFQAWLRSLPESALDTRACAWQQHVLEQILDRAQVLLRGAGPKALIGREVTRNERTTLVTAGTVYNQLRRALRASLPLLAGTEPSGVRSPGTTATGTPLPTLDTASAPEPARS